MNKEEKLKGNILAPNKEEKLLFDYFLSRLEHFGRQNIKTSKDLIEVYERYTVKDVDSNCSCCAGERNIINDE